MRATIGIRITCALALALAACGGGDVSSGTASTANGEPSTTADAVAPDTTTAESDAPDETQPVEATGDVVDGSGVDWATVDLTTIDWANIDMSTIDFQAISNNPTAADLTQETQDLITSRIDPGSATLTIGDQVWEFESFVCAFGHDATQSSVYSFSSDSRGEHEGAAVQMQANIRDESGEGRYDGDGLTHEVYIQDISDFENPSISLDLSAPQGIVIDGNTVTAEGLFDDALTPEAEEIPGTLEATCGTMSRR